MTGRAPKINRALRSIGLPPLIEGDDEDGEPMTRRQATVYVVGFFGVYALGFAVLVVKAWHGGRF